MEQWKGDKLHISVRNLVEFILRSGDLDNRRMTTADKDAMQAGSRLHRKLQGRMGAGYTAEVPLAMEFPYEQFTIVVEGRADGILEEDEGIVIDEIKGVYRNVSMLQEPVPVHQAQAMCYAFIYGTQKELDQITVQMTYCNIETEDIRRFRERFLMQDLQQWMERLVTSYYKWALWQYMHRQNRQQSIATLEFPFSYRPGQRNLAVSVYKAIARKRTLYIQAPTGIGKTISTVFPAVKAVGEGLGNKIFYLTAKTITRSVACESFQILQNQGLDFSVMVLTAKEKVCVQESPECNPLFCERAKGHFGRINEALYDIITHESALTRDVIESYAAKHRVCPYEFALDISGFMDAVICDYNYVFDPTVKLRRYFGDGSKGSHLFLVDEAHNLVERAREMYSAVLYKEQFDLMETLTERVNQRIYRAVCSCNQDMLTYKRQCERYVIRDEVQALILHCMRLDSLLGEYLEEHIEFPERKLWLEFYFSIHRFLETADALDEAYEIYTNLEQKTFYVKLFCMNPSNQLQQCMTLGNATIFFSATLLPVNYYKELLSGNLEDYAIYVDSPFPRQNRCIVAATDVTSRYTRRGLGEYERIARYIQLFYHSKAGNYMVFFPSYQMLEAVWNRMEDIEKGRREPVRFVKQQTEMSETEREAFLAQFEECGEGSLVAFCVLGGVFSEGIDLAKERLIGSIIVGTGLPQICPEREILKDYFNRQGKNGFDFAYRFPGINKVEQAAGRVIRTMEDRGVIGLLDERFQEASNRKLFPREWADMKQTGIDAVEQELRNFWRAFDTDKTKK